MEKKFQPLKLLLSIIINVFALYLMSLMFSGFQLNYLWSALLFMLIVSLFNAFIRPFLIHITLPVTILTLGFFSLFINAVLIFIASRMIPEGIYIDSLWTSLAISFGVALVNGISSSLFSIDSTESYYRNVVRREAKKQETVETDKPGIIFLEIDGLSHPVFQRALQNAYMPTLSRWIHTTHKVTGWECDTASSTPACQAGILLGNNSNMPAFRWFDRKQQKTVTLGDPNDSNNVEKAQEKNDGLLSNNGVSINNMFAGDAKKYVLTSSKLVEKGAVRNQSSLYYFFLNPYTFIRVIYLVVIDLLHEFNDSIYQKRRNVDPRVHRGLKFIVMRVTTQVIMRDMAVNTIIGSMYEGDSTMYATFVGYDEISHFAGNERAQAMYALQQLDKQFAKIEKAAEEAPRPYNIVILSDHGHSQGATFLQRYGYSLEEFVKTHLDEDAEVTATSTTDEGWAHVSNLLTEIHKDDSISGKVVKKATKKHAMDDVIVVGPKDSEMKQRATETKKKKGKKKDEVMVYASGNLGLVTFTGTKRRLSYEQLNKRYPGLVDGLANHEGVGFVMVRSTKKGGLVIGADGTHNLKTGKISGVDPLKHFGKNAALHLKRTDTFSNAPDILVNSMYDPGTGEVAGFEEMVSVHGGMGGNQNKPFMLYPKELNDGDLGEIVGAESLHKVIKKWADAS